MVECSVSIVLEISFDNAQHSQVLGVNPILILVHQLARTP